MGCLSARFSRFSLNPLAGNCLVRFCNVVLICVTVCVLLVAAGLMFLEPKPIVDLLNYDVNATGSDAFLGGALIGNPDWMPQPECEFVHADEFIKQPISALSGLVYIVLGLYMWMLFVRDIGVETAKNNRKSRAASQMDRLVQHGPTNSEILPGYDVHERPPSLLLKQPIWSLLFGANMIFVGVATITYHSTYTVFGAQLDTMSLWAVFVSFSALSLARLLNFGLRNGGDELCCSLDGCLGLTCAVECTPNARSRGILLFTLVFFGIAIGSDFIIWQYIDELRYGGVENYYTAAGLAGVLLLCIISLGIARRKEIKSAWLALLAAILGAIVSGLLLWLDTQDFMCSPKSMGQLHAVWHATSAVTFLLMYMFFRGDKRVPSEMPRRLLHRISVTSSHSSRTYHSSHRLSSTGKLHPYAASTGSRSRSSGLGAGDALHHTSHLSAPRPSSTRSRPSSVRSRPSSVRSRPNSVSSGSFSGQPNGSASLANTVPMSSSPVSPSPISRVRSADAMSTGSRSSTGSRGSGSRHSGSVSGSASDGGGGAPRSGSSQRLSAGRVKQSTMPRILESDQEEVPSAVAVDAPNPVVNKRLSDLRERQRQLREQQLRLFKERERVKRSGGSVSSGYSGTGSVSDRMSVGSRSSAGGDRRVVARWTCSSCGHTENELENERCLCGHWRPPLQSMIPVTRPVSGAGSSYQLE